MVLFTVTLFFRWIDCRPRKEEASVDNFDYFVDSDDNPDFVITDDREVDSDTDYENEILK